MAASKFCNNSGEVVAKMERDWLVFLPDPRAVNCISSSRVPFLRWLADHLGYEVTKKLRDGESAETRPDGTKVGVASDTVQWSDGSVSRDDRDFSGEYPSVRRLAELVGSDISALRRRIDRLDGRSCESVGCLSSRIAKLTRRIDGLTDDVRAHGMRLNSDAAKVAELSRRVDDHDSEIVGADERIFALVKRSAHVETLANVALSEIDAMSRAAKA